MDLAMPIMDGVQATAAIRNSANKKISEIPVIFVTTNDFEHEKQRCFDAGATDYMLNQLMLKHYWQKLKIFYNLNM
jgi:CheY-like chemotaxis protein